MRGAAARNLITPENQCVDWKKLEYSADMMQSGREIYFYGAGSSGLTAEIAEVRFLRMGGRAKALKESHIFGGMQERLMVIGYETGATDEVMEQSADLYQKELQDQIQKMIGILEPTLVGILCVIVGVILLSVMLPLAGIMAGIG